MIQSWTDVLTVSALVFLVILFCREITCWYFKLNALLEVAKEIRDALHKLTSDLSK